MKNSNRTNKVKSLLLVQWLNSEFGDILVRIFLTYFVSTFLAILSSMSLSNKGFSLMTFETFLTQDVPWQSEELQVCFL